MKTSKRLQVVLALAVIAMLLVPWAALADLIVNDIDTNIDPTLELRTINAGGTTSVGFFVRPETVTGDANGCNATGSTPAVVNLSVPTDVSASVTSLTFTDCGVTQSVTFTSNKPGSYEIGIATVTGGKAGSSWDTSPATFTLQVNGTVKQNQTITFGALPNKTYGDPDFTVSAAASSGLPVSFSAAGNCTVLGNAVHITDAGSCSITASQPGNSTYNPAPDVLRTFSIAKAPLQITASSPAAGKYGDLVPTITPSYSGFVLGEGPSVLLTPPTCSTTYTQGSAPNDYPTTCTGATSDNYEISYVAGNFHVAKALLTVTASSPANIYFNDPVPTITPSYNGFVLGEGPSVLTPQPTCSTNYTVGSPVGSYTTSCTGGVSNNYEFNYVNGQFNVLAWTLNGFYQPVDMNSVWNTVKGGATVPLKFEVFAGSTELTTVAQIGATFVVKGVACPVSGYVADDIELTVTGGTTLRYDATAGQFIQNWQTPKNAGSCYQVTLTVADGSSKSALFKLK